MLLTPSIGIWVDPVNPASVKYLCDKCLIATFEGSLKKSVFCSWILARLQINPLPSLWTKTFQPRVGTTWEVKVNHQEAALLAWLKCFPPLKKEKTENLSHINFLRSSYKWEKNNKAQCDSWLTEQKDSTFLCFFVLFFFLNPCFFRWGLCIPAAILQNDWTVWCPEWNHFCVHYPARTR